MGHLYFLPNSCRYKMSNCIELKHIKGATKTSRKIIFVSTTEIGENTTNILNYYVSNEIRTFAYQNKYLHAGK